MDKNEPGPGSNARLMLCPPQCPERGSQASRRLTRLRKAAPVSVVLAHCWPFRWCINWLTPADKRINANAHATTGRTLRSIAARLRKVG